MLKTLLANVDGMVYRRRLDPDWTMEFVSQGCLRVTGHQPADILLNNRIAYDDLTLPDDRLWVREAIRCAVAELRSFDLEYRIVHADGSVRWVWERGTGVIDVDGRPIALEGLIQDITKRKSAETMLRESRAALPRPVRQRDRRHLPHHRRGQLPGCQPGAGAHLWLRLATGVDGLAARHRTAAVRRPAAARGIHAHREGARLGDRLRVPGLSQERRHHLDLGKLAPVLGEDGRPTGYEGTVEDITERRLYQVRIEHQANYDTLTGLANRSLLQDRLQQALLTATSFGTRLAVAFVDLDRFKFINDSLGHHVGDELLKAVAARVKSCVRECDTVARLGGDEFVLLINGHSGPDSVRQIMERMLAAVAQPWVIEQGEYHVSCSIGVALHPEDGEDALTLLKHADSAMYRAKDNGRDNFQFFTRELNTLMTERLEMEGHLRRALERQQFVFAYQPRVDLDGGRIIAAEALLRWRIPNRGTIMPQRFIALAEDTGLIVPIGKWVLQTACAQNKAWQDEGLPPIVVSVNVSARQFRQESIVQTVAEVLRDTGLEARYLELELTESMVMHDAPQLVAMLDELKELGVQIAVDDFGTGYSSLSYLKRFPVDRLKIDRSFVEHIASDADDATIVRTIIALGHNLGLKVVAEGVESDEQLRFLRSNLCDEAQGFLMGRPVSARHLRRIFTRLRRDPRA